jgi:hypothetical protein
MRRPPRGVVLVGRHQQLPAATRCGTGDLPSSQRRWAASPSSLPATSDPARQRSPTPGDHGGRVGVAAGGWISSMHRHRALYPRRARPRGRRGGASRHRALHLPVSLLPLIDTSAGQLDLHLCADGQTIWAEEEQGNLGGQRSGSDAPRACATAGSTPPSSAARPWPDLGGGRGEPRAGGHPLAARRPLPRTTPCCSDGLPRGGVAIHSPPPSSALRAR